MGVIEQETAIDRVEVAILGLDDGQTLDGLCLYPASVGDLRKLLAVAKAVRNWRALKMNPTGSGCVTKAEDAIWWAGDALEGD